MQLPSSNCPPLPTQHSFFRLPPSRSSPTFCKLQIRQVAVVPFGHFYWILVVFVCKSIAVMSAYYYSRRPDNYESHYLDACSLCGKSLRNSDIFMYRGNTPFCSKECRQEQMAMDEAREKNWKSGRSLGKSNAKKTVRTGTVAVA